MNKTKSSPKAAIKKAIIPVAGLGTRFLPLSKSVPKELWPLVEKPVIHYIVKEAMDSGIKEITFVVKPEKKRQMVLDYFQEKLVSKKISGARYKQHFAETLEELEKISNNISLSYVVQKEPLGDGHAILQAKKIVKSEPCAVLFADDVVESKMPCLLQMINTFEKYKSPIIGVYKVSPENFQFYGMISGKKLEKKTYLIDNIIEKPSIKESPSDLAIVGRYIITPEFIERLEHVGFNKKGEILFANGFLAMLKNGEKIYGCQFEGKWLECGNKLAWLKSNLYLSLKHPKFGPEIKKYLKEL